jgi:ferredoxin-type protein NapH
MANIKKRYLTQWLLLLITLAVIGLGWKYPILGFIVPLAMLAGIIGALFNGRYVCGNLCPRGAFFDRLIAKVSPQRQLPSFFRSMILRITILVLLMGMMIYQLSQNIGQWEHWGRVFWLMCTVTTVVGVVLAFFIRSRTWCSFCPIGTVGKLIGSRRAPAATLQLDSKKCVGCRLCEKVCPMNLTIISNEKTVANNGDCIKCWECIAKCPRKALSHTA